MKNRHFLPIILFATAVLPDVAVSCRLEEAPEAERSLACSSILTYSYSGTSSFSHLNAFVYFADSSGLIDSYQAFGNTEKEEINVSSTSGVRRIVLTANFPSDAIPYEEILDYDSLCGVMCNLSEDNPKAPFMSGEIVCSTGPGTIREIQIRPLMARVVISTLEVDFSTHPYRKSKLENIKAYLTNVNGRCPLVGESSGIQSEILNYGGYDPESCKRMAHPEMLFCEDISAHTPMYCYPNSFTNDDTAVLGRGVTRLVIEGCIDGETWYYPISVGSKGVERGKNYIFDIKITGTGVTDPDSEAQSGMVIVNSIVKDWTEYEEDIENY